VAEVILKDVGKVYPGGVAAVEAFNLTVSDGEFVVLVGPSGCGKSTTLRMVAGLEEVSAGTISIGGRVVNDVPPKDRDIAMVFQNYALYPHMTVRENLAFGLKLRRFPKDEIDERIQSAARILGLSELLERRPKALSGGQRQRVAVGRAIVRKPAVFLFDAPLSNLDAKLRVQMRVEISRLHAQLGATMVYVTHDQVEAMTMGDRIVVMHAGRIQQVDEPLALYERPANRFVASFIGTPPMNLLEGRLEAAGGSLAFRFGELALALPAAWHAAVASRVGTEVVFGVRPEDLTLPDAVPGDASASLPATVDVVEPMGFETYVYLKAAGRALVARVDSHTRLAPGQTVALCVRMPKTHLFDPASGLALV